MKTITLKGGEQWACNGNGEGVFSRKADGTWQQYTGTGQTPTFTHAQQFSRYVHANYRDRDGNPLPRMTAGAGW